MRTPYFDGRADDSATHRHETQGYSLDAQRVEIERYCEQHGYDLVRFYADEGVSAHTDKISKRPE